MSVSEAIATGPGLINVSNGSSSDRVKSSMTHAPRLGVLTLAGGTTHMTYYYYKDANGEWRWRLKSSNAKIIADSGEGYKNESDCLAGIDLVKNSKDASVVKR